MKNGKRVCISTWYRSMNYGTGLQALALQRFLENLGYTCYFLEDKRTGKEKRNRIAYKKGTLSLPEKIFLRLKYKKSFDRRRELIRTYDREQNKVFTINTEEDIVKLNRETDLFVAGGDQIWNPYVLEEKHLLTMAEDGKKMISFGTSVGVSEIPLELRAVYTEHLSRFQAISVREEQSVRALDFLQKEVMEVVDPTLLFDAKGWSFLTEKAELKADYLREPYILCYFVGERKTYWSYVEQMQKETGYRVLVIPVNYAGYRNRYEKVTAVTVKEFLALIQNAAIVCTDSFHATVFSIQYQKEFYVLKRFNDQSNQSQNGRLKNMLERYCLDEYLIRDESCFQRKRKRDYQTVLQKIQRERERSVKWLMQELER